MKRELGLSHNGLPGERQPGLCRAAGSIACTCLMQALGITEHWEALGGTGQRCATFSELSSPGSRPSHLFQAL